MKSPAPHPKLVPVVGDRVAYGRFGHPLVKRGLKEPDQRNARHPLCEEPDTRDVRRIVCRRDAAERLHGLYYRFVEPYAAIHASRHDRLETHCRQLVFVLNLTGLLQLGQTIFDRLGIIHHALEAAFVQQPLWCICELEQSPLQRRRTQVGYENLHTRQRNE